MFTSLQKLFGVWMRVAIAAVAIVAVLVSFAVEPKELGHPDQPVQIVVASAADTGLTAASDNTLPTANCHLGQSCVFVIMPTKALQLPRVIGAREFPQPAQYPPSKSGYPPFHPPRNLSQV